MVNLNNPHLYVKGTYEAKFFDIATNDLTYYSNKLQTDNIKSSINLGAINAGIGNPAVIQIPDTPNLTLEMTAADFSLEGRALQVGTNVFYNAVVPVDEVCAALGCTRPQLQQAFRARLHRTAMEEFSAMRIEYAAQLLARGASPGEVAAQMGYCSGAYFSQKFRAATGHTPSAYRRIQQGLPARRQNRQQKGKSESKTPIAETPQKE